MATLFALFAALLPLLTLYAYVTARAMAENAASRRANANALAMLDAMEYGAAVTATPVIVATKVTTPNRADSVRLAMRLKTQRDDQIHEIARSLGITPLMAAKIHDASDASVFTK